MTLLKALVGERRSLRSTVARCRGIAGAGPVALIALGLLACGDDSATGGTQSSGTSGLSSGTISSGTISGGSGGNGGSASSQNGGNNTAGGFATGAGGSTATMGVGGGCAGTSVEAQKIPLDMYVMLDQSGSMNDGVSGGGTKWSAVTGALDAFVAQPAAAGLGIGIQFFGYLKNGGNSSCNAADYANPAINGGVEIGTLPGVASAFTAAIAAHTPNTKTPTSAALQGAVDHAKAWQIAHPDHLVVALLATDGDPTECDTNVNHIKAIAATALAGTPSIKTFVIGIGTTGNLNAIAASGGTTQAFIVNTAMNTNTQFLAALNAIQGTSLPCNYIIPDAPMGQTLDFGSLNVQYSPGNGDTPVVIPNVANAAACPANGDAWYYDNPTTPTQVILCGNSCSTVQADPMGKIHVVLGCQTTTAN